MPVLSGIVFLAAAPVVGLLLPSSRASARCAPWPSARSGLAFANFASVVLMTVGRQAMLMPTALVSIMLGAALDLGAVKLATASRASRGDTYAMNGAVLLTMALTGLGLRREVLVGVGRLYLPMGLAIAFVWTLERYLPGADASLGGLTLRMLGSMLLFGVLYTLARSRTASVSARWFPSSTCPSSARCSGGSVTGLSRDNP